MNTRILYIFTRTPLHVGAGSSVGAVDQPIQRERHTGFPIIPGSSIKGVMREHFRTRFNGSEDAAKKVDTIFGWTSDSGQDNEGSRAGAFAFSEAKLLAFPLRSAKGSYALATCPLALQRYARFLPNAPTVPEEPSDMHCLAGESVILNRSGTKGVVLEEYAFSCQDSFPQDWVKHLSSLLGDAVIDGARKRWVLLSNGDFSHFALNATQVSQHVRISPETGTVDGSGLFNEETVPSETLFFSTLTELPYECDKETVTNDLADEQLIQFGGNGTTGLGFCTVKLA